MHRALTRTLAGACALVLLLGACGGDDGDDDADTTTTEAEGATTTEAADGTDADTTTTPDDGDDDAGEAEADALAERINLTIDDFSDEWSAEESDDDGAGDQIDDCFTTVDIDEDAVGEAETPSFSLQGEGGQGQFVSMQTVVFPSPTEAGAVMAEAATPEFAGCVTDVLVSSLGADAGSGLVPQPDDPAVTEEALGVVGEIGVTLEGAPVAGLVDVHLFRTAEVVTFTATLDLGPTGFFEDTLTDVYGAIATRHTAEVG